MHPDIERELTYLLLIELLAYQFASPVKWIQTQDVLLKDLGIQNLVEVGPVSTLINMIRRTLQNEDYVIHDSALGLRRKLLSYRDHAADIHRGFTSTTDLKTETVEEPNLPPPTGAPPVPSPAPPPATAAEALIQPSIPDAPASAQEIVLAIISLKLDRALGADELRKSVKQLCGGRSTMQNEIIGDLEGEFGSLPEDAEGNEIQTLCDRLQASPAFSGQLRRTTTAMVSKMVSLKMPASFRTAQIRGYLERRWALGSGRQDTILLSAGSKPPAQRLASPAEAQSFLDDIVVPYLNEKGLTAPPGTGDSPLAVAVPPSAQALPQQEPEPPHQLVNELYSRTDIDLERDKRIDNLQGEIDSLVAELGDELIAGVQPQWSALHVRHYDSYWNWSIQDLYHVLGQILRGSVGVGDPLTRHKGRLIANRACPRLLSVAAYLHRQVLGGALEGNIDAAAAFLKTVMSSSANWEHPPTIKPFALHVCERLTAPRTVINHKGDLEYSEVPRVEVSKDHRVSLSVKDGQGWVVDAHLTATFAQDLENAKNSHAKAPSFASKIVLLIGASRASIGSEILCGLLVGGAHVIVTTSRFTPKTISFFRDLYVVHGARGAKLHLVSFNQASQQDVRALVDWVYDTLGLDLDHIVPFAAISVSGSEVDGIDARAELAHRMMLINVLRLLGQVAEQKRKHGYSTNVTQILLPLSPNHGVFGGDGLYAESKVGLEPLFAKWASESWGAYLSLCGASIGWTRGTGLMKANDLVAEGMEERMGIRTFGVEEMALQLLLLMAPLVAERCETAVVYADLTGGLGQQPNLKDKLVALRQDMQQASAVRKAILEDQKLDDGAEIPAGDDRGVVPPPLANLQLQFPELPAYETEIRPLAANLCGMVDLDRIVVVAGTGEIGPHGSARTRWEMEAKGRFSLEGCIEMAWLMGMIRHTAGEVNGKYYNGWADATTGKPVADIEVKSRYEQRILAHTGIRLVEPELDIGWDSDPTRRQLLQEVVLTEDLPPVATSKELAHQFQAEHGDRVDVFYPASPKDGEDEEDVRIRLKKGATILVPKGLRVAHAVAGQIPTGWDPKAYGLSDEIISLVDRVTLFTLVCVAEALFSSGLTDAYELYRFIHVSELGNCIGSGLGGINALKSVFRTRHHDLPVASDVLQETFINTAPAWVNMLLISGSGPLRTPVGACATALESLESGYELISTGKAKVCLVGGVDDLDHDIAVEFANMGATSNPAKEEAQARIPAEASRPTSSTRAGFVEAHGAGVQLLTTARLALDMGLPVHGVIAWAGTASDKVGRSVPAPGQGLLTNARESSNNQFRTPLLNISYRRRRLEQRLRQIHDWEDSEKEAEQQDEAIDGRVARRLLAEERRQWIASEAIRQRKNALATFGHQFWHGEPCISPIRGSLAVWGLTINDLDFASFHGTSTVRNDLNETDVIQKQLAHLGREDGHLLYCIFQKYLTGHSKGAAAAWMLNGCLQTLGSGLIPGQRNADNIDERLRERELLFYPSQTLYKPGLKAFSVTSFGFGQKGAQAIGVHPRYMFAAVTEGEYHDYCVRVQERQQRASQAWAKSVAIQTVSALRNINV
ncbi:PKS/NRPS-like protein biosynthetic cluster [Penicillium ucsense]|uniref:PKS/NRPS-like protein biosynthetic cluster n=1 Tax=Penicillium ucsense TaxID=2839758 RepID=A0A8J8WEF3_9EURO|nr:PKS/NRPS-like protein biosynthetic cluster [Penicillium ucsense]KAF7729381.1 PKS/NRPS-like protein biosynthetic cluster [Penicillium ucsense]